MGKQSVYSEKFPGGSRSLKFGKDDLLIADNFYGAEQSELCFTRLLCGQRG